ncbi:MAG: hypothetical protein ACT4PM_02800 [Gemmatimonadales bacterium]
MRWMAAVSLLVWGSSPAFAQRYAPFGVGTEVRLRAPRASGESPRDLRGTVEEVRGDTITIRRLNNELSRWVWTSDARTELLVHGGKKSSADRGLAYGGLAGAAVGIGLGIMLGDDPPGTWLRFTAGEKALLLGGGLGATGGFIGLVIGALSRRDIWIPARGPVKVRPLIGVDRRGGGVALSVSF